MAVFGRADFEERVERVRRRQLLKTTAVIMMLAFGYPAVLALHAYGLIPSPRIRLFLLIPLLGFVAAWFLSWMSLPRLIRRMGLNCPACAYDLWATGLGRPGRHAVLETGKCPKCGTELLDASEAGARPAPVVRWQDDIGGMTLVGLMLLGLVAFAYFGKKSYARGRTDVCARRYAEAKTAADTIRVDQSGFRRSSTTCEYYRR
jgi:hypothetical protein